ncbi:MAG: hypothetical protein QXX99_03550 [Candidatus Bathyarchaeia archaeon]
MLSFWNVISEFRRLRERPVFSIVGFDTLEYVYDKDELLKVLGADLARVRNFGDVRLNIIRPERSIAEHLSALADIHIVIKEIYGALFLSFNV